MMTVGKIMIIIGIFTVIITIMIMRIVMIIM